LHRRRPSTPPAARNERAWNRPTSGGRRAAAGEIPDPAGDVPDPQTDQDEQHPDRDDHRLAVGAERPVDFVACQAGGVVGNDDLLIGQGGTDDDPGGNPADDEEQGVRGLARDLPEPALHMTSRRPATESSAALLTCAVVWVGEVLHGVVNDRRIGGKDGVADSIPAGSAGPAAAQTGQGGFW
jgi:hypothetical protein